MTAPQIRKYAAAPVLILVGSYCLINILFNLNKRFFDMAKDEGELRTTVLNTIKPNSFSYLIDVYDGKTPAVKGVLSHYLKYYQAIASFMPSRFDAHGLSGFCQYHTGNPKAALEHYAKAAALHPSFLWYHYNLGVINFERGDYESAAAAFYKATQSDPQETVKSILNSTMIYIPLLQSRFQDPSHIEEHIRAGYAKSRYFLGLSLQALGNNEAGGGLSPSNALQAKEGPDKISKTSMRIEPY